MTYQQGTLPLDRIYPDPTNIRADLGDLTELAASIKANGILQPLLVRPAGDKFVLIDGHRRHAAGRLAGIAAAPVLLAQTRRDSTAVMLAAAMHKALELIEQARAFKSLRDAGMGTLDIAKATGYSANTVRHRLILLDLPTDAQRLVQDKTLGLGQATSIARQVRARGKGSVQVRNGSAGHYFSGSHPLADIARCLCTHDGERPLLGGHIACGPCWEAAIRADATGEQVDTSLDESAIQRAVSGDPARLSVAELDEAVHRLTNDGLSASQAANRLRVTKRTVERSRARSRERAA